MDVMEMQKMIGVARLMRNRERLVTLENILSVNMKSQDVTKMYDKLRYSTMTEKELSDEIIKSEASMGNIGRI